MKVKEPLHETRFLWIALLGLLMTTPAAAATNIIKIKLHVSGAIRTDRILTAAIDDHHFCRELTRGWTHSITGRPIGGLGDKKYFDVPIYHVAFNQPAPHLRPGLDGHPGFSLDIDDFDSKIGKYEGDKNTLSFYVALNGKHYKGYRDHPDSSDYNPRFHYHVTLDADRKGGQFTASHLVENNDGTAINVTGNWHCQTSP